MKTITYYMTLSAIVFSTMLQAQSTDDSGQVKKPLIIDGKKVRITIDTKIKSDDSNESKIIIDKDTIIIDKADEVDTPSKIDKQRNEEVKIVKKVKKKSHTHKIKDRDANDRSNWFHADLGLNFLTSNNTLDMPENYKDLELENGKGCNFNLKIYEQSIQMSNHFQFLYGVGLDWNNYRFKNNIDLNRDSNTLSYMNSSINYKKNKLVSNYLIIPLMIKVKFNENSNGDAFQIAFGPQFGYLLNSYTKQKWEADGKQKKKTSGDYNLAEFRMGYTVYLGFKDINFYARYYPNSAFKENQGPDVNTVCVGLAIGGF